MPPPSARRPFLFAAVRFLALCLMADAVATTAASAAAPQQSAAPVPPPPAASLSKRAAAAASAAPSSRSNRSGRSTRSVHPGMTYTANGTYVGFDAAGRVVHLLLPTLMHGVFTGLLTPQTSLSHGGASATVDAFVPGEPISVRLQGGARQSPGQPIYADAIVLSLSDASLVASAPASGSGSRAQILAGTVAANTGAWLDVRVPLGTPPPFSGPVYPNDAGSASLPPPSAAAGPAQVVRFRITAKTQFYKDGHLTSAAAYPPGSPVAVKPRALPRGERMAVLVAENAALVAAYYRDSLTLWRGQIAAVNPAAGTLLLARDDGAQRTISVDALTAIHKQRHAVGLAALAAGDPVSVHLRKGAIAPPGYRVASQVIVSSSASRSTAATAAAATHSE